MIESTIIPRKQQQEEEKEHSDKLNSCMVYSSGEINRIYFKDEKIIETTTKNGKRILKRVPSIENINDLIQILLNEPILELKGENSNRANNLKISIDSPNNTIDNFDLSKLNPNSIVFIH